jgi:predicted DNA-binding transcriptional regulator AlpA
MGQTIALPAGPAVSPDLANLPAEAVPGLLAQCAALLAAVGARLASPVPTVRPPASDRLLTAEEAAALLGVTPAWLIRRAKRLPFSRSLSRKIVRFSEVGLQRWAAARKP